ncbi:hypothetical protein PIB30_000118 [Stylosanthes scabra]|uniref:Disease resistance protein RGA3 n=1 Tax=Stylosanthes scabra TaxID=79078 RepID=A0ABU6R2N0_9FABA|nr:hypothetical protein [Stylosanthes scabra]
MAEQIPYGVATSLINRIASVIFREIGRIYGVMEDLEKLKDTLESIKVMLSDAELKQGQDATVAHWLKRFKRVLHDADHLLDDVYIQDLRLKANGGTTKMSKVRGFLCISDIAVAFRAKLAHKIDNIQKDIKAVADDMATLNLNRSLVLLKPDESAWRETSSAVLQSEIIGREESKSDIVNLLKQTHPNHNVSLVVVVDFGVKTILKKMLESLKKDVGGDLPLQALQQKLQEELNGHKYMLVIDDVWNEVHLKLSDLRTHLMCGGQGSKILVTTRSKLVSETMDVNTPYELNGLMDEQSWTLLKNVIFGEDNSRDSSKFQTIGEKIAKKCEGVPLAIKTIGGFLRTRIDKADQWSSLLNDDIWRLCKDEQSIMPVLSLSYRNLPLELRQCFAYCCLYPKDSEIQKDELIQMWMAQGYLESSIEVESVENVGNQYVKILLMGSFFQEASMDICGDIESFKMHDLMHDLAMSGCWERLLLTC